MSNNSNLQQAKKNKFDEFYTMYDDIDAEVQHYKEHLKGKVVYCNCSTDESNFVKYFKDHSEELGIKKLLYSGIGKNDDTPFESERAIELLKEADIVIDNPPFSLGRKYIDLLMEYDKDFLIIMNQNGTTLKNVFPLFKDNKVRLGYTRPSRFLVPEHNGEKEHEVKLSFTRWFTTLPVEKNKQLVLTEHYYGEDGKPTKHALEKFPKYDNYDAINVDKVPDIPIDYEGVMGIPITFLDKFNPEQFEIVSFRKGEDGKDLVFTRERERVQPYFRILVRHRLQG